MNVETTTNTGAAAAGPSIETPGASRRTGMSSAASAIRTLLHHAHGAVDWWRNDPMTARFDAERRRQGLH